MKSKYMHNFSLTDSLSRMTKIATSAPGTGGAITVKQYSHTFIMSSIIARIEGSTPDAPLVIIGAHLDSINQMSPSSGKAPGADDNGTGSVNLIEAFRKLAAAGFKPANPVEFHWYSGEEGGLLGSAAIAKEYARLRTQVKSMLNIGEFDAQYYSHRMDLRVLIIPSHGFHDIRYEWVYQAWHQPRRGFHDRLYGFWTH